MRSCVEVIGHGPASEKIKSRFRDNGGDAHPLSILAGWSDIPALQHFSRGIRTPWMIVEDAGDDAVSLGPVFRPGHQGCFACYIARRRANGGQECRPAPMISDTALDMLQRMLEADSASRSRLSDEQIVVTPDGAIRRHAFLPIPGCATCASGLAGMSGITWSDLVSSRLGLVHDVRPLSGLAEPLSGAIALGCRTDAFWSNRALNRGMAVDDSAEGARRRAVLESIERYCAAAIPRDLPLARPADLDRPHLDPSRLGRVRTGCAEQRGLMRWVQAHAVAGDWSIWVPASAVYVPYPDDGFESAIEPQCSVGLAAHTQLDSALRHGMCEVVERDTTLRAWRLGLPVMPVSDCAADMEGLHLARVPCESGLQVVVSFIESATPPFTSTGMAARETLQDAARHATFEAVLSQLWLRDWLGTKGADMPSDAVRTMVDNAVAHAIREDLRPARRRWLDPKAPGSAPGRFSSMDVLSRYPDACFVDLTTSDVAAVGLRVVRVLIPDKVLSDDDSLYPRLGGDLTPHPFG